MALPPEEAEPGRAAGQNWWPEGEAGQALEHRQYVIPVLGAGARRSPADPIPAGLD